METPTPSLSIAEEFSTKLHKYYPRMFLAYNLSPSFNWDAAGMSDDDIGQFAPRLGKLGYVWQVNHISLSY